MDGTSFQKVLKKLVSPVLTPAELAQTAQEREPESECEPLPEWSDQQARTGVHDLPFDTD